MRVAAAAQLGSENGKLELVHFALERSPARGPVYKLLHALVMHHVFVLLANIDQQMGQN